MIDPDCSFKPFIPEVFNYNATSQGSYSSLFWDNGYYLYAIQDKVEDGIYTAAAVIRINMQMQGAPYYGIK